MIPTATAEKVTGNGFSRRGKIRASINLRQFTIVDRLSAKFRRAIP